MAKQHLPGVLRKRMGVRVSGQRASPGSIVSVSASDNAHSAFRVSFVPGAIKAVHNKMSLRMGSMLLCSVCNSRGHTTNLHQ